MESSLTRRRPYDAALVAVLVVALVVAIFICNLKAGFHVDELWTFGLSNSFYFPHIFWDNNMDVNWIDSDFIQSYLTVDPGQAFRFDSVIFNLSNDAHPPLYFFIIHCICSLFPGEFNKWFGLVPNLFFYLCSLLLFFRLSNKVFQSRSAAIFLVALWGFSPIALNLLTYIRMYLLLVTLALAFLDVLYDAFADSTISISHCFRLFAISFLGFLTHYYFYIFLFFVSLFFAFYFWISKGWKSSLKYGAAVLSSVCLSFVVFPSALTNIFGNHYAESAASQSGIYVLLSRMWRFIHLSSVDLFFGSRLLLITCFCITVGFCLYLICIRKIHLEHDELVYLVLVITSSLVFYVAACYISPFVSSRYTCLAYPGILLSGFAMIWYFCNLNLEECKIAGRLIGKTQSVFLLIATVVCLSEIVSFSFSPLYLYPKSADNEAAIGSYVGSTGLFVSYDYYQLTAKLLEANQLSRIHAVIPEREAIRSFCKSEIIDSDNLIVYMSDSNCKELVLSELKDELGYSGFKKLPGYTQINDGTSCFVYVLYK